MFKLENENEEAIKKMKVIKRFTAKETAKIKSNIDRHMMKVNREFKYKMGKSMVSARNAYVG